MTACLHAFFSAAPLAAVALALALGYLTDKIRVGTFVLGPVAATLLVAIALGQVGVQVSGEVKTLACGRQASTPAINAVTLAAGSNVPVLGYTVPYTVANVLLTLAGPVVVLPT